jgi:hypothetical protein
MVAPLPFWESEAAAPPVRRLLLVSHCFPPDGNIGALRWQKLAVAAYARGWQIDVIMMDPAESPLLEESRLGELPPGTRLFGVATRDPLLEKWQRGALRLRNRMRAAQAGAASRSERDSGPAAGHSARNNGGTLSSTLSALKRSHLARLFFERWLDWAERAAGLGVSLAKGGRYAMVASSGPPHLAHEAARKIAGASGIPHVMDLRDPWFADDTEPAEMRSALWKERTSELERRCVSGAAMVVLNTDSSRALLTSRYPSLADRFITVMNGADADVAPDGRLDERFTIAHAGSLYSGRDPRVLFRGVARAVAELGVGADDLCVRFMGDETYEGTPIVSLARESGIDAFFESRPMSPRAEALAMLQSAAMVVLLPQGHVHSIPGKVFEYVQLRAWLLILSEPGTATEMLLRQSTSVLHPNDVEGIATAIVRAYRAFRAGERPMPVNADGRFDRARQATTLLQAMERLA